ncbi:ferredoxin [Mangrovibacterium diazotrophicum]|uniref:Ferredoxin n=1 Tax=Mangrovibacterium diazotrophicum TaxID=1261403 RepID=A0A419W2R4_9BACT|nr:ferredoxin [Mangrovibacterium diazotrophicum]RKD89772.1 ferredoxin [Mangrovibacterium diazotrophicum]
MAIDKIWRDDDINTCVACKICQSFAPRVFKVFDKMIVMPGVDYDKYENEIREAVESCPTGIIKIEYK